MRYFIKLFIFLVFVSQYSIAGKIILAGDEWAFSNTGFSNSPDASIFAQNIANSFANNASGNFHAYSNSFSLIQSSLANTMTSAGHSWSTGEGIIFDLPTLLTYDGIFFASSAVPDYQVLTDYVNAGGNIYISGGTSSAAASVANEWNPFLNNFGLEFGTTITFGSGNEAITSMHPIFDNVNSLYQLGGQEVFDILPNDPKNQLVEFTSNGIGIYAIYEASQITVPLPPTTLLFVAGLIGMMRIARNKIHNP